MKIPNQPNSDLSLHDYMILILYEFNYLNHVFLYCTDKMNA